MKKQKTIKEAIEQTISLTGYELVKIHKVETFEQQQNDQLFWDNHGLVKVQHGCGGKFLKDWVNLDYHPRKTMKSLHGLSDDYVVVPESGGRSSYLKYV